MDKYIIIGGSHLQLDFIKCAKAYGLETHVIDYNPEALGASEADVFHCISIDDKDAILALAEKIKPIGIHTVSTEQGNVSACYVGEKLNLATNSYKTSLDTTNKVRMKAVLAGHHITTPSALCITDPNEVEQLDIKLPIMVKAADRSAGRGVQMANTEAELNEAIAEAFLQSFEGQVLLEEYLDAPQYSVETVSYQGKHQVIAITKQWMDGSVYCVETGHYLPAKLSEANENTLSAFCIQVLDAFDIQFGACHVEIRIKDGIVSLIEIASRMGGWRHWMVDHALKTDYQLAILKSSLNENPFVDATRSEDISICRIITCNQDIEIYREFIKLYPERMIVDLVEDKAGSFKITSLIDASGLYIYKSNEQFENTQWLALEQATPDK
jgi:biotin carboxylase